MSYILGIETSCDDTSVALVDDRYFVKTCLVASQDLDHAPFGGVVPEIASRSHTENIMPLIDQMMSSQTVSWDDISGIAVTNRPGLVGSLIVGLVTAKALAMAHDKPFLGVHHLEGHIVAPFLSDENHQGADFIHDNFVALVVSGGHTQLYAVQGVGQYQLLGETQDDAAGEAFDKFAKMLGLPYPGGVQVDRLAQQGVAEAKMFPRSFLEPGSLAFSFSGLKSAGQRAIQALEREPTEEDLKFLCASYQQAIIDVLSKKLEDALSQTGYRNFVVSGGVSANSGLRLACQELAERKGYRYAVPPLRYCTDNAAMIALAGLIRMNNGERSALNLGPIPRALL